MSGLSVPCQRTGKATPLIEGYIAVRIEDSCCIYICKDARRVSDDEFSFPVVAMIKSPENLIAWLTYLHSQPWFDLGMFMSLMYMLLHDIAEPLRTASQLMPDRDGLPDDNFD